MRIGPSTTNSKIAAMLEAIAVSAGDLTAEDKDVLDEAAMRIRELGDSDEDSDEDDDDGYTKPWED